MLTRRATVSRVSAGSTANVCVPSAFTTLTRSGCCNVSSDMLMLGCEQGPRLPQLQLHRKLFSETLELCVYPCACADRMQAGLQMLLDGQRPRTYTALVQSGSGTGPGFSRSVAMHQKVRYTQGQRGWTSPAHFYTSLTAPAGRQHTRHGGVTTAPPPAARAHTPTMYNPIWEGQNWKQDGVYMYKSGKRGNTHPPPARLSTPTRGALVGVCPAHNTTQETHKTCTLFIIAVLLRSCAHPGRNELHLQKPDKQVPPRPHQSFAMAHTHPSRQRLCVPPAQTSSA
jgi:hypothetical protein